MLRSQLAASISAIAYHLGDLKPIADLDFLRDDPEKLTLYGLSGFEHYAESQLSMRDLAYRSAIQTLQNSGIDRSLIDVCLYVAESHDRDEPVNSFEVNRLLVDLELNTAVPIHVSVSNCANIVSALRVAAALLESGSARHILVVSVDKASQRYGGRQMFQEMSIKSDISVSCLVSRSQAGGYRMLYTGQHNSADLACSPADSASYSVPKFRAIRSAARQACEAMAAGPDCFRRIITNNYSRQVTEMFVGLCGFPKQAGCCRNIGRFAHAVAGDVLINLKDLECAREIQRGDLLFLLADSITLTSVLCLEAE
jgi:3-oxoacyl-[acyl-carrier-protein] synthase III